MAFGAGPAIVPHHFTEEMSFYLRACESRHLEWGVANAVAMVSTIIARAFRDRIQNGWEGHGTSLVRI